MSDPPVEFICPVCRRKKLVQHRYSDCVYCSAPMVPLHSAAGKKILGDKPTDKKGPKQ